jgi:hypothetical protein
MEAERTGRRTRRRPWAVALEPVPLAHAPMRFRVSSLLASLPSGAAYVTGRGVFCACGVWFGASRLGLGAHVWPHSSWDGSAFRSSVDFTPDGCGF